MWMCTWAARSLQFRVPSTATAPRPAHCAAAHTKAQRISRHAPSAGATSACCRQARRAVSPRRPRPASAPERAAPPTCPGAAAVSCAASSSLPVPRAGRHGTPPRAWHPWDAVCRLPRPVRGPCRCSGPRIPRPLRMPSGVGLSVCGVIIVSLTQK